MWKKLISITRILHDFFKKQQYYWEILQPEEYILCKYSLTILEFYRKILSFCKYSFSNL